MANKTKIIQYSFQENEDDGHNNKVHTVTKKAIFLDPRNNSGVGFLIIKSSFGTGPYVIYLTIEGETINSFCFGDNFGIEGFPIPGQENSTPWNEIEVLSSENLLLDHHVESLVSYFKVASLYYNIKTSVWEIFKDEL